MNSHVKNTVNLSSQATPIAIIENDLQNWSIPEESFNTIYQIGKFSFLKKHNIKTSESTVAINNSLEIIQLFNELDINRFKNQFNYLHVGLVQVAIKPLFRQGLDIPVCAILRDARLLNFDDSLLGVIQSNLSDGPVYFNCYPNFSVDINDPNIMDVLTLNVKTKNMNSKDNTREIAIIYRVYYRLMGTTLAPKARLTSPKGVTTLMEANKDRSTVFVPKALVWDDILHSNDWHFEAITRPTRTYSERSQIERIIQHPDGSIDLKFLGLDPSRLSSSRRSVSTCASSSKHLEEQEGRNNDKGTIRGVDYSGSVPKVYYQTTKVNEPENLYEPGSPSASEMAPPQRVRTDPSLFVIRADKEEYIPDLQALKVRWNHPQDALKRKWYGSTYSAEEQKEFGRLWIADMKRLRCDMQFFFWFEKTGRIENQTDSLNVIVTKWYTQRNTVVESTTPPLEGLNISYSNEVIKASPFKTKSERSTMTPQCKDLDRIIEQNNYTNQVLHTISRQIEDTAKSPPLSAPLPVKSTPSSKTLSNPIFKLPEFHKEKFPQLTDDFKLSEQILENINSKLTKFKISQEPSSSKDSSSSKTKNSLSKRTSERFSTRKNYYRKPSPPDVQFEENPYLSTSNHDGRGITEWNIDGLAEHQIYNKLHEIAVAITAYKIKGSSDKGAATMVVSGFTGMIKHWWDNYVSEEEKNLIYNATVLEQVTRIVDGQETLVQEAQEDACATLLYHIARHFVGEPKLFQDRSLEILNNLRCKNLVDFRWYKDTFLVKVMIRPDCNNDFWKERFISGLPPLFADKVQTKLKDRFEGQIPYNILTYGDLVSFITTTGIELCTDLKLKQQLKQNSKYGLTTFCHDYGFTDLNDGKKHKKMPSRHHKRSYPKRKTSYKESNKPRRKSRRKSVTKSKDTCWTCGKTGHRAKDCKSSKKKKINLLDLPNDTKEKLFSIMEDSSEASDSKPCWQIICSA
ncbi:hypothetical protein P3L10_034506 [Capsicum annuum]